MRVLDLFSGIGGFSLGLERAGMRTVAFCEIDPFCRAVLAKHWPDVPCYDDVRAIPRIGGIDVVAGGFPCQPWSHAGKQLGAQDGRHLWPAMLEVIKREGPAWVIGENVAGIVNLGLDEVLSDLEAHGYAWRTFVIPAVAVDAPHRRDRVWIVGCNAHFYGKSDGPIDAEAQELCTAVADAADADGTGLQGWDEYGERAGERTARPRVREQHWPSPEPWLYRVDDGVSSRMDRLKALGNAVVPQVVEAIGRAAMRAASVTGGSRNADRT